MSRILTYIITYNSLYVQFVDIIDVSTSICAHTRMPRFGPSSPHVEETVGAMLVSEAIVQLADFARARLTLLGKSKVVQDPRRDPLGRGGRGTWWLPAPSLPVP